MSELEQLQEKHNRLIDSYMDTLCLFQKYVEYNKCMADEYQIQVNQFNKLVESALNGKESIPENATVKSELQDVEKNV